MQCSGTTSNDQEREITKQSMRPAQSSAEINGVSLHRLVPTSFKAWLANGKQTKLKCFKKSSQAKANEILNLTMVNSTLNVIIFWLLLHHRHVLIDFCESFILAWFRVYYPWKRRIFLTYGINCNLICRFIIVFYYTLYIVFIKITSLLSIVPRAHFPSRHVPSISHLKGKGPGCPL